MEILTALVVSVFLSFVILELIKKLSICAKMITLILTINSA